MIIEFGMSYALSMTEVFRYTSGLLFCLYTIIVLASNVSQTSILPSTVHYTTLPWAFLTT